MTEAAEAVRRWPLLLRGGRRRCRGVVDAGVAEWWGDAEQQDTRAHVVHRGGARRRPPTPPRLRARVLDGHRARLLRLRGLRAAAAVKHAIQTGEPSPLAAARRTVADDYAASGEQDGACASACLLRSDGRLEVINCGDCRTVLGADMVDGAGHGEAEATGGDATGREHEPAGGRRACDPTMRRPTPLSSRASVRWVGL